MKAARYLRFTRNSVQTMLAYRANVLFYIFGNIVQTLVLWYLWRAIFAGAGSGRVNGFTLGEMAAYLLAAVAAQSAIGGNAEDVISEEIMEGSIAVNLARPLDYRTRIFFGHLGASLYNCVVVSLPALAIGLVASAELGGAGVRLAAFAASLILGFALHFFYKFMLGLTAILTTNVWGVFNVEAVVSGFLSGALVPLAFFPDWARTVTGLLPFASMVSAPALAFAGKLTGADLVRTLTVQGFWVVALALLSSWAWNSLVSRVSVNGG
ncbi:MAG: ABC-2 family transporter protein [Spirochaetales bacterium]|nr:ABC-2 family transporter protein [Spirochaetales bacterium]